MTPEQYFFHYALPCADVLLSLNRITKEQYDKLQRKFQDREVPSREELEKAFEKAFFRIKRLAQSLGLNYWDMRVMQKYWIEEHNRVIDAGEGLYGKCSETLKDICRVHESRIIDKKTLNGKTLFVVEYDSGNITRTRTVFADFVPEMHKGDRIRIHHSFAIEKI